MKQVIDLKQFKRWESDNYRIDYRGEIEPDATAKYYALARCRAGPREFWNFVGERRPYRTYNAAETAILKHQRLWRKYAKLADGGRKGRLDKARQMIADSVVGTEDCKGRILSTFPPVWVTLTADLEKALCGIARST